MGNELGHPQQPRNMGSPQIQRRPAAAGPAPIHRPLPVMPMPRRREAYTQAQKERAIRLLNNGVPCRQVAALMGPRCSSGTPIRWRKEALRALLAQRQLEQLLNNNF